MIALFFFQLDIGCIDRLDYLVENRAKKPHHNARDDEATNAQMDAHTARLIVARLKASLQMSAMLLREGGTSMFMDDMLKKVKLKL